MGKIIYIVTEGVYSDYGICGIFSKKEYAQKYIEMFVSDPEDADIEEWLLDDFMGMIKKGYLRYVVYLNTSNFNLVELKTDNYSPKMSGMHGSDYRGNFYTYVFAKNEKHAIKIASERLAQYKAEGRYL